MSPGHVVALSVAAAIVIVLGPRRRAFTRRARSLDWPCDTDPIMVRRYARHVLNGRGWSFPAAWPWYNIALRASKGDKVVHFLIANRATLSWPTLQRDALKVSSILSADITILLYGRHGFDTLATKLPARVAVINVGDLVTL